MKTTSKPLGYTICQENGWSFEEVFRQQYRISKSADKRGKISTKWNTVRLGDWTLEHCKTLPLTRIKNAAGKPIGLVLGVAITPQGECLGKTATIKQDLEGWIEALAGRYVVLIVEGKEAKLYQDPSGNLSTVFNAADATIAASVTLAIEDAVQPHTTIAAEDVVDKKEKFLFGETSDIRVTRAQPNHFLDLNTFTQTRHWPREDTEFATLDQERIATFTEFSDKIRDNVTALIKSFSCALPITAGRDSRIILASAASVLDQVKAFYCYELNTATRKDVKGSAPLAQHLGIPFQIISRKCRRLMSKLPKNFMDEEHRKMLLRTGWCYHMRADWGPFIAVSPRTEVVLRGTGIEMTRANKWNNNNANRPCSATIGLYTLTGLRPNRKRNETDEARYQSLLGRYQTWMSSLPATAQARTYDLAHIELMLPAGPVLEYSAYVSDFMVNPINDRRLYQLAAGVAPRARLRGALVDKIISRSCPSIRKFPYFAEISLKK